MKCLWFAVLALCSSLAAQSVTQLEWFETDVRPILARRCHECHGPAKQKSSLRLDHIEFIRRGGERGPAIVAGDIAASRLAHAIDYTDPDLQMPPTQRLPQAERDTLKRWIEAGAPWPNEALPKAAGTDSGKPKRKFDLRARKAAHWAWRDLTSPTPPAQLPDAGPHDNEIDAFVFDRLAADGIRPTPPADRATLLRRVTFDLIGLPPTSHEVRAFLTDESNNAYERVVDRLLDSPHFGEKWARHWLDLVRYAETLGHEFDYAIPNAWRYRDYLVRAFNADVPYDRLIEEHVAGDLIESPRRHPTEGFNESMIGTAFWWFAEQTHSPVDVRQHTADRIANQVDVLTKSFLGLTVACARCHDHKFDAISTRDYYALSGYLKSSIYAQRDISPQPQPRDLDAIRGTTHRLADAWRERLHVHAASTELAEKLPAALEKAKVRRGKPNRAAVADFDPKSAPTTFADFRSEDLTGWFAEGNAFGHSKGRTPTFTHGKLGNAVHPAGGWATSAIHDVALQGVLHSPSFDIEQPFLHFLACGRESRIKIVLEGFHVIRAPIYGPLKQFVNDATPRWYTADLSMWLGRRARLVLCDQHEPDLGESVRGGGYAHHGYLAVQRIVFSNTRAIPHLGRGLPSELHDDHTTVIRAAVAAWDAGDLSTRQAHLLNWLWREGLAGPAPNPADQASVDTIRERLATTIHVPALADSSGDDHRVYIRGSHKSPGDVVPRRFLSAFGGDEDPRLDSNVGSGRARLAQQIIDNPLAPRVFVNRLWHHLFGRGIVPTVDNFGVLGEPPSDLALLDWLARRAIADDWSIKRTLRRMVMSRTYRRSSHATGPAQRPMPMRRLTGESIRDAILMISGRLDPTPFGNSVPPHVTRHMTGRGRPRSGPRDGAGRRSIYQRITRNFLSPFMLAFDMPPPASTVGRRDVTNVPAQALTLLNDPFVAEQAELWAKATVKGYRSTEQRIDDLYLHAFARPPRTDELEQVTRFLATQRDAYDCDADDVRPWRDLCHSLWNVKEFIYLR